MNTLRNDCFNSLSVVTGAERLRRLAESRSASRIAVFSGKASFRTCGGEHMVGRAFCGIQWHRYALPSQLLTAKTINAGLSWLHEIQPDMIVAMGGGSVIDFGKCAGYLSASGQRMLDDGSLVPGALARAVPVVAIATTSGTGAEVTPFSSYWVDGRKQSLHDDRLTPSIALGIPALLESQPRYILTCSALDALTQAIEAFWSVKASALARRLAIMAIELVWPVLRVIASGGTPDYLALSAGARISGEAIALSHTTACHALSYPLTGRFGIPHGHAVAITLPEMLEYVGTCPANEARHKLLAEEVRDRAEQVAIALGANSVQRGCQLLDVLLEELGIERKLGKLGCGSSDAIELIVNDALSAARMDNFPRLVNGAVLKGMLQRLS